MAELGRPTPPPYDPAYAVRLGLFVKTAYWMYDNAVPPVNPTPVAPTPVLPDYDFVGWVQMKDFFLKEEDYSFYGILAQNQSDPNRFVLAIRGTRSDSEWWVDIRSQEQVLFPNFGPGPCYVGVGFYNVYKTLRVVTPSRAQGAGATSAVQSLESVGNFAAQVAAAMRLHAAGGALLSELDALPPSAPMSVQVVGHSLGSALATLYVAENTTLLPNRQVITPLLCTLASPYVGDPGFAAAFNALPYASWRIVNTMDIVPDLPIEIPGLEYWQGVNTEYDYDSGWNGTWPTPGCWHSLETYLHLLDSNQPLLKECQPLLVRKRPAPLAVTTALPHPADKEIAIAAPAQQGTTINITIKVG